MCEECFQAVRETSEAHGFHLSDEEVDAFLWNSTAAPFAGPERVRQQAEAFFQGDPKKRTLGVAQSWEDLLRFAQERFDQEFAACQAAHEERLRQELAVEAIQDATYLLKGPHGDGT